MVLQESALYRVLTVAMMFIGTACCAADRTMNVAVTNDENESLQEVCEKLKTWHDSIVSLEIHLRSEHADRVSDPVHAVYAAHGEDRYYALWHGDRRIPDDDPLALIRLLRGPKLSMLVPFIRRAEETNQYTNEYRWKVQQTTYFESIGWWAGDPANIPVHPDKRRWFIPEILSCSELRLLEINDHSAVISVAGVTRIHVDLQHGFIRLRQDEANLEGGAVTGKISGITLSDFRKADGIYLPFRIERLGDDGRLHTIHAVKSCSINCVPESRFVLEYKPGTFVIDRDSDNRTFSAGGVDCLERILLHQSKHLPTQEHLLIDRFVQWSFGIMLGFVVTGVIGKK